jgi:putative ABC transport system ATP-binding protein
LRFPDEQPALCGHHLIHSFGEGRVRTPVLRDVSLDLYRGEVALLMGPSGSGKSTLLSVLSGLQRPQCGRVTVLGQDLWGLSDRGREHFRLCHFGFVFQGHNLFPALTAYQQLEMVLRWGGQVPRREVRQRVLEMLDRLGLSRKANLRPAQLSGGEKQRVGIGRAPIKRPTFCFADEPTSALDWGHGERVVELLRAAAREDGAAVLVVAHDHRFVPFADRCFHLEDGRFAAPAAEPAGSPDQRHFAEVVC